MLQVIDFKLLLLV